MNRKVVTRPPCQIAQAQAPLQACLRPGMWLPGVKNLHSARETWKIKAGMDTTIDRLVAGVEDIETEEHLVVHEVSTDCICYIRFVFSQLIQVNKERNYVEIFVFTPGCNWLDVVEVRFSLGKDPSN